MFFGIANTLTLFRIVLIPVVVALFYLSNPVGYVVAASLFLLACVTDFLDGYVARALHQTTNLGRFLDPMADKLLVASTLLLLVGFRHIQWAALIPAIIILCREILVSGLREVLAELAISVPVTGLAKWKTTCQMTSLFLLIAAPIDGRGAFLGDIGVVLLWIAAVLTLWTGYDYLQNAVFHMRRQDNTAFNE